MTHPDMQDWFLESKKAKPKELFLMISSYKQAGKEFKDIDILEERYIPEAVERAKLYGKVKLYKLLEVKV